MLGRKRLVETMSLKYTIGLPVGIAAFLFIISYAVNLHYNRELGQYDDWLNVLYKNRHSVQLMLSLADDVVNDSADYKGTLNIEASLTDKNMIALELGGVVRYHGAEVEVEALPREMSNEFQRIGNTWSDYKGHLNTVLIERPGRVVQPGRTPGDSTMLKTQRVLHEMQLEEQKALAYLKKLTGDFAAQSEELIRILVLLREQSKDMAERVEFVLWLAAVAALLRGVYIAVEDVAKPLRRIRKSIGEAGTLNLSELERSLEAQRIYNEVIDLEKTVVFINEQLRQATATAEDMVAGNYNRTIGHTEQPLMAVLAEIQEKFRRLAVEDQRLHWRTEGLASFVEILRTDSSRFNEMADRIVAMLLQYVRAEQGGLFVVNDRKPDDVHLELVSAFAFNRKKYITRRVSPGEGLVGQVLLEKETIHLKQLPDSYLSITSGLGEANPRNILIVPLKVDSRVEGVLELASFHVFERHEIDFVERLAESIASTIASMKITAHTRHLLEESQGQAERLRTQEEEMRQANEELLSMQDEMTYKEKELEIQLEETQIARRQAEEQHQLLSQMAAGIPAMLFRYVFTPKEKAGFAYVSEGSTELFGKKPQELMESNSLVSIVSAEDIIMLQNAFNDAARTMTALTWEGRFVMPDGKEVWRKVIARPEKQRTGGTVFNGVFTPSQEENP